MNCKTCKGSGEGKAKMPYFGVFISDDYGIVCEPCSACKGTGKAVPSQPPMTWTYEDGRAQE